MTPTSLATRPTRLSPVSTIGTSGRVGAGVDTGVPETLVAWPTKSSAVAVYLVLVAKREGQADDGGDDGGA